MNGAELLIQTAVAAGIDICFANPGTTELPLVAAIDAVGGMRASLGLFEGCCTGAADGYGRMTDRPALTILHLGPGLANGIANLHNARRARTPVVNLIGEHATWHRSADAPLTMDIEALAGSVSGWQRTVAGVDTLSADMADAISAAARGQVASLIVPQDLQWAPILDPRIVQPQESHAAPDSQAIAAAAELLRRESRSVIVLGGRALRPDGLKAAAAICHLTGCELAAETFPARMERGQGLPNPARIPYFPEAGEKFFSKYRAVVLAGARDPVAFFGYRGGKSRFLSESHEIVNLSPEPLRPDLALICLAEELAAGTGRRQPPVSPAARQRPDLPTGKLSPQAACAALALLQPENAVIVDESITSGGAYYELAADAPPHTLLALTGGSIGQGIPCAVGAALACPDRAVINLQADGSALYTLQALWMQAREGLNITTLICANHRYDILKIEMMRAGCPQPGAALQRLTDLGQPAIDWVKLSTAMGVPAVAVDTADGLAHELRNAIVDPGPHLIAMAL